MNKLKKTIAIIVAVICLVSVFSFSGSAVMDFDRRVNINNPNIDPNRFEYEWEYSYSLYVDDVKRATLVYGFDMDYIDEDYAWTISDYKQTCAGLKRSDDQSGETYDTDTSYSAFEPKQTYAKKELNHSRDNVYYICILDANYSGTKTYETVESELRDY